MLRALALSVLLVGACLADDDVWRLMQEARKAAEGLEVQPLAEAPEWARDEAPPIFRFVQFSDIHHWEDSTFTRAIEFTNREVKPDWAVLTGDNLSAPYTEEHQRHLKDLLGTLACPSYVMKGDNDAREFEKVFGSSRWSFDCGGVHFVAAALDYDAEGAGIGHLDRSTWKWLRADLDANRDEPTIFLMHVNVVPPDFLDAARLGLELSRRGNVVATVTGHIHDDLEYRVGRMTHIVCPGLGPHERHGFKLYEVHEDHITVKTYEVEGEAYVFANKWQRIPFPERLHADASKGKDVVGFAAADPLPTTFTPGLTRVRDGAEELFGRLSRALFGSRDRK
ncbi:MAG: metallophosphoesterase [Planctomycetota bacterium]